MTNKLVSKYSFEMPDVGDITTLTVSNCASISPNCWIWNTSVGYLEVIDFKEPEVTVRNLGRIENAKAGSEFPSCMEFLIVAPDSLPLYDPTVTCLAADFISPEVNDTAIMVVVDTSKIRETDVLIIDRKYRYTVVAVIDEHQLEVRNEGWGKEPGEVIDVVCDECISVKILESTYCCKVVREELQEEIDDINDRLDNKKSILPSDLNNLVSISGGANVQTDAPNDTVIYVDDDLSKYDNSVSKFITDADIPRGNLTVSSTDNVLTINSGSGTGALLKNANVNLDLSAYAKQSDIPAVGNGTLTIQNSGGTTLGTFTANQSGNTVVTIPSIPPIPTVPSVYSGSKVEYYSPPAFTITLQSENNDGSAYEDHESLSSKYSPVSISSSGVSGTNVTLFGNIVLTCSGTYTSDTHTFNLAKATLSNTSYKNIVYDGSIDKRVDVTQYRTLVTSRGPSIWLVVNPKVSTNGGAAVDILPSFITSGKNYYYSLDSVDHPLGSETAPNRPFSIQMTIPIMAEVIANATYTVSLDITIYGGNLRKQHQSGTGDTFVNEPITVSAKEITAHTTLGWVIK